MPWLCAGRSASTSRRGHDRPETPRGRGEPRPWKDPPAPRVVPTSVPNRLAEEVSREHSGRSRTTVRRPFRPPQPRRQSHRGRRGRRYRPPRHGLAGHPQAAARDPSGPVGRVRLGRAPLPLRQEAHPPRHRAAARPREAPRLGPVLPGLQGMDRDHAGGLLRGLRHPGPGGVVRQPAGRESAERRLGRTRPAGGRRPPHRQPLVLVLDLGAALVPGPAVLRPPVGADAPQGRQGPLLQEGVRLRLRSGSPAPHAAAARPQHAAPDPCPRGRDHHGGAGGAHGPPGGGGRSRDGPPGRRVRRGADGLARRRAGLLLPLGDAERARQGLGP